MITTEATKKIEASLGQIHEALKAGQSDNLKKYLTFASRFHKYSLGNQILIWSQNPNASKVAGFGTWVKMGRSVIKGSKAMYIYAPCKYSKEQKDGTTKDAMFFKMVPVFDISQTEGEDLPTVFGVSGDPGAAMEHLVEYTKSLGIEFNMVDTLGGPLGVSHMGKIEVINTMTPAETFATLVHEVAHEVLHTKEDRQTLSKTVKEAEAELTSFVVCNAFGVDTLQQSSDYAQMWGADVEVFKASMERIQKAAKTIIEGVQELVGKAEACLA